MQDVNEKSCSSDSIEIVGGGVLAYNNNPYLEIRTIFPDFDGKFSLIEKLLELGKKLFLTLIAYVWLKINFERFFSFCNC